MVSYTLPQKEQSTALPGPGFYQLGDTISSCLILCSPVSKFSKCSKLMPSRSLLQNMQAEVAGLKAALSKERDISEEFQERIKTVEASLLHDAEPTPCIEVRLSVCVLSWQMLRVLSHTWQWSCNLVLFCECVKGKGLSTQLLCLLLCNALC